MPRLRNQRHEKFCRLFVHGNPAFDPTTAPSEGPPDTRNNAKQSYLHADFHPRTNKAARQGGYRLLQRSDVRRRINELRDEEQELMSTRQRRWKSLVPDAQELLLRAVRGEEDVTGPQIQAAREIIEQAVGPTRFRFGVSAGADKDGALNIQVYGGPVGGEDE